MDIPSLIPRWIYDPDAGKQDPAQDPQRSWDRDPDIKPIPTDEDAYAAARYKRAYGDPNTRAIDIGDPYARQTARDFHNRFYAPPGPQLPVPTEPITPQETDYLRKGQLMVNQMPVTTERYDPKTISISRGNWVSPAAAGYANPYNDQVWAESNREEPSTVAHEYGHSAYLDLYRNNPEARDIMHRMQDKFITPDDLRPENGFTLHELLTHANLQRNFGPDVEGTVLRAPPPKPQPGTRISYGGGARQYQNQRTYEITQDPEFKVMMRQLDKMAAHRGAQRLIERQGGVFQEGGKVGEDATNYWNTPLDPQQEAEFQQWAQRNGLLKDLYDYDMRGAYMSGIRPGPDGHWPDTYKKPNHPTFSEESQYHGSEGHMGGRWGYDETGSETLQPYDPRSDPEAFQRAVNTGTQFADLERAYTGLGDDSNNADVVERLKHPTYQQLAEDKDLRRGRTRMAPRGRGAEGGFGYQGGGPVQRLPDRKMNGRMYEHEPLAGPGLTTPMPKGSWSTLYSGPQHDDPDNVSPYLHTYEPNPDGGDPLFNRWKLKEVPTMLEGGSVAAQDGGKMWDDSPFGNWGTSDILHVARGVPGYEHLQQAAQDYLEKIEGHQRQGDTPGSYVAAGVRDVRSIPNEELKDNRKTFKDLAVEENRYPMMQTGGPVQPIPRMAKRPLMRYIEPHVHEFKTDPTYPLQGEDEDEREPPEPGQPGAGGQGGTLQMMDEDDDYQMPIENEPPEGSIERQVLEGERQQARERVDPNNNMNPELDEDEWLRRRGKSIQDTYQEIGEAGAARRKMDEFNSKFKSRIPDEPAEQQHGADLPEQPRIRRYRAGGAVDKLSDDRVGKLMDDPEHGSWHDDGKFQIYTPHMSFFHGASPHELVDYFLKYHPDDHRLNLP